jgi:hypothetical protein
MEALSTRENNFNVKKVLLLFVFLVSGLFLTAQESGISLKKENSRKSVFLKENKRIKIRTVGGEKIIGNYTIVDDETITIKGQKVGLDSIVSISKHSRFSSVASPVFVGVGSIYAAAGTVGLIAGGYGVLLAPLIPLSLPLILVPILANKHKRKAWKYEIVN